MTTTDDIEALQYIAAQSVVSTHLHYIAIQLRSAGTHGTTAAPYTRTSFHQSTDWVAGR